MNLDTSPLGSSMPSGDDGKIPASQPRMDSVFLGPHGIRAGWRLLIAISIFAPLLVGLPMGLARVPALHAWLEGHRDSITPGNIFFGEGAGVIALMISAFVMSLIEKRSFADYGLPGRAAFGKRFWQGLGYG